LNLSYARSIGLHIKGDNGILVLEIRLEVEHEKNVNVHVKIQQYQFQVSCLATKLRDGFDLILGDNWLKHRAHIDYDSKACILHKGNKKITISNVNTSKKKFKAQDKIFSALQFKRAMKKGCQSLFVQLKKIESKEPLENSPMESISLSVENSFVGPLEKNTKIFFN
jgi:hypothetical protein